MVTLHLHKIQHSIFLLAAFLLQFSLLQLPSLGYDHQNTYFINCGSDTEVNVNNNLYIGESNRNYPKTSFSNSYFESNQSTVPSTLYQRARIFHSESSYEFDTLPNNTYMVRFHFFSFSSPINLYTAKFSVSVPGFSLLHNFDAKNTTNPGLIKEYFVKIIRKKFKITFTPQNSSFAFVNAIELFMLPTHLIPNSIARFTYTGSTGRGLTTYSNDFLSRSLETKHRLNIGGENVTRESDNLSREWLPDDSYITDPQNAKNGTFFGGKIKRAKDDEYDGLHSDQYTAPDVVYQTAKESKNGSVGLNISWSIPVEKNIDHFLRLHFCDNINPQGLLTTFILNIYDQSVITDLNHDADLSTPYYYDFVVRSDASGLLTVSVVPNKSAANPNAFLNGLELMKVIELSGLIPLDDSDSNSKISIPVVVGSVVGGLVLVLVVVVLFLWFSKTRKQKPVENSEWLPVRASAGGSSHSRLTDATTIQGSPLPNINLGLKLSLLDLQFATENFDAKRIIGKGGFGNVYKGVLKNGMTVAVKRSEPGSGQGLPEFQAEIMVLSKIRHRHLVSLVGYCDERPAIDQSLPRNQVNLAEWGIFCKDKGILEDIIDPSIKGQIEPNSLRKFSETVDKCLQDDGSDRPSMGDVLWDLEYALQLQRGAIQREPHEDSSSSASVSIQLPNVRRLPSLSTLTEMDDMSMGMINDESNSAEDSVFSQLKIDDAR
ncbi:receptor protein kinase HERK [Trifolium repens]|nr:receptor protein kinase HERK [Trifolium repens]